MPARPQHVHLLSMHTSPLAQPGVGDAGGMNVYVAHLSRELAGAGIPVTVWTARRTGNEPDHVNVAEGLDVRHVALPGTRPGAVGKNDLRHHIDAFAEAVVAAAGGAEGQLVHAHYWLSGLAGLQVAEGLGAPLVTSLHTTAHVKNLRASVGEDPEPDFRIDGEHQVVEGSDAVVVNTATEARQMVELYGARPEQLRVITPGIDPTVHHPPMPDPRDAAATDLAQGAEGAEPVDPRPVEVLMAARLQPLKGPGLLVEAIRLLVREGLPVHATIIGNGDPDYLGRLRSRVSQYGLESRIRFVHAQPAGELAARMGAADIVAVPSSSETFGLVALEAQGCATPVVASRIDGLTEAVLDGTTGVLVADRTPEAWARALGGLVRDPALRRRLGRAAAERAGAMTWATTADRTAELYAEVLTRH
ncbi:D-inositol-3-phosphate glycosyltransferase [Raineyella antarctica]|uniref:D-inositol-3-phosphate glycosyltransferase n=1 Tax=Raineyella antarctica TaxID=1577474 RepID=A0A1G6GY13_9ACTN|nr:glycosyltransferase [Raineyella antarctica]SDB86803.1 D-inositol-3-phosphate glycosyltransferase [Raineyella antarctica]